MAILSESKQQTLERRRRVQEMRELRNYVAQKTGFIKPFEGPLWWIDQYINDEEAGLPHL